MDPKVKQTALRMIPYGLYVLTGGAKDGRVAGRTVNWVTQASFEPPLLVVGVRAGSQANAIIKEAGSFALNVLGRNQQSMASAFFKPPERHGNSIGGEPFCPGKTGAPILDNAPAYLECSLVEAVERGDHSIFIGEVVDAGVRTILEGRPDDATLRLKDLGESTFYGG